MLRKEHAASCQSIYVGGLDFGLAKASQLTVSQVVCQYVNDVWFFGLGECRGNQS